MSIFQRLQAEAKQYENIVGKFYEHHTIYELIDEGDKIVKDYDCLLIDEINEKRKTIEVKVNAGSDKYGSPYQTCCVELTEWEKPSHWLTAPFDLMCYYNRYDDSLHFYKGQVIRDWAEQNKGRARWATHNRTTNITMPWICKESGHLVSFKIDTETYNVIETYLEEGEYYVK